MMRTVLATLILLIASPCMAEIECGPLGVPVGANIGIQTEMSPDTLMRVQIEDGAIASQLFDQLMGDDVEPRRNFIEKNARYVRNLDV